MSDTKRETGMRRRMGQAVLAYAAASFVILQIADMFREGLGLPDWVFPSVLALLIIGLPVIIAAVVIQGGVSVGFKSGPVRLTMRRAMIGGAIAFAVLTLVVGVYMATRALGIGPAASLLARGALEPQDRILFSDFENRTADSLLAQTVAEALAIDLSQSRVVRVVSREELAAALGRMQREADTPLTGALARELAVREGVAAVVEGTVAPIGSGYIVTARLVPAADGPALASLQERARSESELLDAVDRLGTALRDRIGESLRTIRSDPPLPQVTTSSLTALRAFAQARRTDDHETRTALLEEAVAVDSTFAMAWRHLAWQYRVMDHARAAAAWTKAWELRDRLSDRERHDVTAQYHMWVTNDLKRAAAAYESLLELYPEHGNALDNLSILYDRLQDFANAELIQRQSFALDTTSSDRRGSLVRNLADQGKFDEAEMHFAVMQANASTLPFTYMTEAALAIAQGQRQRTEEQLTALGRDFSDSPYQVYLSHWFGALLDATGGRLGAARHHLDEARRIAEGMGAFSAVYVTSAVFAPQVELVAGDPARARAVFREASRAYAFDDRPMGEQPIIDAAEMEARAGSTTVARQYVASFLDRNAGHAADGAIDRIIGIAALVEGDYDAAISHLTASSNVGCVLCSLHDLGRAYEAAGNADSAIVVYTRFIETPTTNRLWAGAVMYTGPVMERLSALHEEVGDTDAAVRYAVQLTELWADADPELQPRVDQARSRVVRLRPAM